MSQCASREQYIELIAAAIQVPSFLLVSKADGMPADPLFEQLVRYWLDAEASAAPSPDMNEFAFALASGLSAHIYGDDQLVATMAGRGYRSMSWVSCLRSGTMTGWMQATPLVQIAHLAACWGRLIDAEQCRDRAAADADADEDEDAADRQATLAWQLIQSSPDGQSFRSAHAGALASQMTRTVVDGRCGH